MSKVLIFGLARSGTELLQRQIAFQLKMPNFSEIFVSNQVEHKLENLKKFKHATTGVAKIISGQLGNIDLTDLPYTHRVVTQRQNLTDCCISLHFVRHAKQFHFATRPDMSNFKPIVVPIQEHVRFWISHMYVPYKNTLDTWNLQGIKYDIINYEQMIVQQSAQVGNQKINLANKQRITTVSSELDYKTLCLNYDEVQHEIVKGIDCL